MLRKRAIFVLIAIVLCSTLLAGFTSKGSQPTQEATEPSEKAESLLAEIDTETLDGDSFTFEDITENKLTMINVWATWCPPCVAELPELQELKEAYAEQGVEVIGVLADSIWEVGERDDDAIAAGKKLLENAGVSYRVLIPDAVLQEKLINFMEYFPTTFFFNADGELVDAVVGSNSYEGWSAVLDEILEKMD